MNVTTISTDVGTISFPRKFGDKKFILTNEQTTFTISDAVIISNLKYITMNIDGQSSKINYSIWVENMVRKPSLSKYII